ncbi:MAG: DNA-3-methyladenine glycosylase I [Planctomycetaceae bacterium]
MSDDSGIHIGDDNLHRCWWCAAHPDYQEYHDSEWGRPHANDQLLFEKVCLEGFQAGLSWLTILKKRHSFRNAFDEFDFSRVARYSDRRVMKLMQDAGIIRHEGKIRAAIHNAGRAIEMVAEFGSLSAWFWQFEPPARRRPFRSKSAVAAQTTCPEAQELAKQLRKRGWKFFGPTTAYAFMQSIGMVNDHLTGCHVFRDVEAQRTAFSRPRPTQ